VTKTAPGARPSCSAFLAISVDGLIARDAGSVDWLNAINAAMPPGENGGYGEFIATVDAIVMGRHTFDLVLTFDAWPYGTMPVRVMSRCGVEIPASVATTVTASNESPEALVARLGANGYRRIYVDGRATVRSFLEAGLIEDLTSTTIPVILGRSRPLFRTGLPDIALTLETVHSLPRGLVQTRYRVQRDAR
jgi:dihydrofolate reductase